MGETGVKVARDEAAQEIHEQNMPWPGAGGQKVVKYPDHILNPSGYKLVSVFVA